MKRRMLTGRILAMTLASTMVISSMTTGIVKADGVTNTEASAESSTRGYTSIGGVSTVVSSGNDVTMELTTGESLRVTILDEGVFRIYMDPEGEFQEDPTPNGVTHTTKIIDKQESEYPQTVPTVVDGDTIKISTDKIELRIDKATSRMELFNKQTNEIVWKETEALKYSGSKTVQTLETSDDEYFYGGGTQNGRFSHKGESINIKNENNWVDGGVASPNPFYWSTNGYGVMRHTFKPGVYDFGSVDANTVTASHDESRFDAYYFIEETPSTIMGKYTELTGETAKMPEYAFYLGHANCYARDWINDETGEESRNPNEAAGYDRQETLMIDGKAVLDAHIDHDMPLGWFMPNDGYGCGYGRAGSVDGNIALLKEFADYADEKGLETSLWTQRSLKPTGVGDVNLERDIDKEVGVAGTNAVKTDVAWVGPGYSFALNSVRQAADGIIDNSQDDARPFIMSLDGWAGTQRYATIWSGDQAGGNWEYIRFHIPTYIGTSLSGNPNIGSDMDGIFGGSSLIQTRDHQWKAFTPIQIDMDGWGSYKKVPYEFGEPYNSINRMYLKLKAEMMPYNYSISNEAVEDDMPMIRAMMLEFPEDPYTYGSETQYQYMWGPNLLVAPIYQDTAGDGNGNDIRNDIYLPDEDQIWIDYFSGDQYAGGAMLNNFDAPLWKTPVFVKNGAIIPMTNENNNPNEIDRSVRKFEVYPSGETNFEVYEDDGLSMDYTEGHSAKTMVTSTAPKTGRGTAVINVGTVEGSYDELVANRTTEFIVNVSEKPSSLELSVGSDNVELTEATTLEEFEAGTNMFFYDESPNLNKYATEGSDFADVEITTTPKVYVKVEATDVTTNNVQLTVNDFINVQDIDKNELNEDLPTPGNFIAPEADITSESVRVTWDAVEGATSYDVEFEGMVYRNITETEYLSLGLHYDTNYDYRVRAVNADGYSQWSDTISPRTLLNPYRNVPEGMTAIWEHGNWSSDAPFKAVDGDDASQFHSRGSAIDEDFIIDMHKSYEIEKLELLFRANGNGSVRRAEIYSSIDGVNYDLLFSNAAGTDEPAWATDGEVKTINFDEPIDARYFKIVTKESIGNFLTMREFRPYKVDGTEGTVVGDLNNNGVIDDGDLTFLQNYAGVLEGDADWGYVSSADLNGNGVIDAYDIAYIASKLEGGVIETDTEMAGDLMLIPSKTEISAGETITVDVVGTGLADINAFGAGIPIDPDKFEVVGDVRKTLATAGMESLSQKRVHGDGSEALYVMFTNVGESLKLSGTESLARFEVRAVEDMTWDLEMSHALVVDSKLNTKEAIAEITDLDAELPNSGDGVSKISSDDITVTGDETQLQNNMGLDKLIDGTTSSDDSSRMDLKWVYSADQADKGELPFEMTFDFDEAKEFANFTIYNRINGDGALNIAAMKKVKAVGYLNGVATDLGEKEVTSATTVYELNGQEFDKIVVTALESYKDQHTLAINEIEFYEDTFAQATGIVFEEDTVETLIKNRLTPIFATVGPDGSNPYYRISSSDEDVVQVVRIDNGNIVNYYLRGLTAGTSTITATTADGNHTVTTEVTVGEGIDKTTLIEAISEAKEYVKLDEVFVGESYAELVEAVKLAEELVADVDATEEDVANAILGLEAKIKALEERDTVEEDEINTDNITVIDATSEADSDFMENIIDGNPDTIWHSSYQSGAKLPVSITLEFDKSYDLNQIDHLPRQNTANGHITKYQVETSLDGENWTVARVGEFEANREGTSLVSRDFAAVRFNTVEAKFVKFTALESIGLSGNNLYASIAELVFYGQETVVEEAYKGALEVAVVVAEEVTEEQLEVVVPVVREEFAEALAEAKAVLADERATQEEVDAAFDRLKDAMWHLDFVAGDKTILVGFVERVNELDEEAYISDTWTSFAEALEAANEVVADENALVESVDTAYNNLVKAYLNLRLKPNKDLLEDLINEVNALNKFMYTEATWRNVESSLARANEVMADEDATEEEVNAAVEDLTNAVNELEKVESTPEVDKTDLENVITEAEEKLAEKEKYTEETVNLLIEALEKAKEVLAKEDATEVEVEDVAIALKGAILGLENVEPTTPPTNPDPEEENGEVNKDALNTEIEKALGYLAEDYTAESFAALQEALKEAEAVKANEEATQKEVDAALDKLSQAIAGLVEQEEVKPEEEEDDEKPGSNNDGNDSENDEDKLPQTGGTSAVAVGLIGTIMAALGFGLSKKKRD